jgi:hypothetical protein
MIRKIIYLQILLISSCSYKESYDIVSPNGDKKLRFEWNNTLNPNDKGYIKIFLTASNKNFISIRPLMDFPIHVYWGNTIKIRGGVFINSNILDTGVINWKKDYTALEETQVLSDTLNWKHYYLDKISTGYYK